MPPASLLDRLRERATALQPRLVAWRRHLHAHPELSFRETATQAFVAERLVELGLAPRPIAGTGVVAMVGEGAERCVALRADLDALPIQEVSGRPYGSKVAGVMHACGHDVHTTCALGAAALLAGERAHLPLPVKLIFQPGEELLPGGATKVIAEGGLRDPAVAAIVGLHVAPDLAVGTFGTRSGPYMASADEIYITLRGPGGHGALPHQSVDLVAAAAQMITALQQVVSRKAPAGIPTVLSFGRVETVGGATNVLPAELRIAGTFRTYDETWRSGAHGWIERIARSSVEMFGGSVEVDIRRGYPALDNDPTCTSAVRGALVAAFGGSEVAELSLRPTAEDFAWYLREVPGTFFRLGTGNADRGITAGVHTPDFDVDEACLSAGALAMAVAALELGGSMR